MEQHKEAIAFFLITSLIVAGCSQQEGFEFAHNKFEADIDLYQGSDFAPSEPELPDFTESSALSDYLTYAALNNPGLEAAFNRWKAAMERVPQVKALPDPRFEYKYFIQEIETRVGPQQHSFGITQLFPWFGKLDLRGDVAMQGANAAGEHYKALKLKLFFEVKDAYYEYYYLAKSIAITKENVSLIKHLESVAISRYRAAAASHSDVIRAQVELGKLDDHYRTLLDLREPIVARLNATLNRPVEQDIPWPGEIELEDVHVADKELLAELINENPELKTLDFEITRNRRSIELAKKDYYPDFTLGLNFIDTDELSAGPPSDNGKDPVIAIISISLPIWRAKYDASVREATALHLAARRDRTEKANSLSWQLKMALYRVRDAERKIDLYRDTLLPKAKESLKVTESGFRSASGSFTDLIDAQRILLEFALAYERALADHAQSLAKLEMLVGREIHRTGSENGKSNVTNNESGKDVTELE